MCHVSAGKQVSLMNTLCDCECSCGVMMPIDDEIRILEDHKKILKDRIDIIDKKITGLKSVNES
jgi:NADH:ubiquinone oxidoreductase subunit E